jgi:hypothetical protein
VNHLPRFFHASKQARISTGAFTAGERNREAAPDVRCHSSIETIRAASVDNERHEHQ